MKRLIITVVLASSATFAQEFKKVGQAGFVFLEIPVSARIAALGEAAVALTDLNADAAFANPAAFGWIEQTHAASFSYATWIAETKHYASSYAYNSPVGVFGLSAVVFDFGTMPRTAFAPGNRVYEILGDFSADAHSLGLSYAKRLTEQFSFGVTIKYVRETIDAYTAKNVLFDGGVQYYTGLGSWRIAASIQHFGTETQYLFDQFKMPSVFRLGTAAEIIGNNSSDLRVSVAVEASHPTDADERINVALEIGVQRAIAFRGSYKFLYDEETFNLGAGILPQPSLPAGFDFSYSNYGRLGKIVRFTLHMELN